LICFFITNIRYYHDINALKCQLTNLTIRHLSIPPKHITFKAAIILRNWFWKLIPPPVNIFNTGCQHRLAPVSIYQIDS